MKLLIEIGLDGAAFQDGSGPEEVATILDLLAGKIHDEGIPTHTGLRDTNGNTVGYAEVIGGHDL